MDKAAAAKKVDDNRAEVAKAKAAGDRWAARIEAVKNETQEEKEARRLARKEADKKAKNAKNERKDGLAELLWPPDNLWQQFLEGAGRQTRGEVHSTATPGWARSHRNIQSLR